MRCECGEDITIHPRSQGPSQPHLCRIYDVEKLLQKRLNGTKEEYLVRWCGYDENHDTWVPLENLNCPKLIKNFEVPKLPKGNIPGVVTGKTATPSDQMGSCHEAKQKATRSNPRKSTSPKKRVFFSVDADVGSMPFADGLAHYCEYSEVYEHWKRQHTHTHTHTHTKRLAVRCKFARCTGTLFVRRGLTFVVFCSVCCCLFLVRGFCNCYRCCCHTGHS